MSGLGVQDGKNMVRLIGGASALGISLAEFWNTKKNEDPIGYYIDEVAPSSVALTLTAYMGLGMFVMALILLAARGDADASWRKEAAKSQVYASALAFLASAFLVGVKTKHTDSVGDVLLDLPGGMFLCLSLVKVFEWVFDIILLSATKDPLYKGIGENFDNQPLGERLAEREQMSMVGFISVAFAITLSAISHWHYECKLELVTNSTGNYTCDYDESPVSVGVMTSYGVIATIVAASIAFVVQGFILGLIFIDPKLDEIQQTAGGQTRFRWHVGFGVTIALILYSSVAALAMSVGRDFSKQHYLEGFLASNYLYYAAILFAFMGVVQFEDFDGVHEKVDQRKLPLMAQLAGAMLVGAFCTAALWGSELLYHKEIVGAAAGEDRERVELGVYAIITVLILAGHTVLVKMVEAVVLPEFKICACYPEVEEAEFGVAAKRTEATLSLALVSAVFFGHSKSELSLTLLFVAACAARFIGYWQRYVPKKEDPEETVGGRLGALFWDSSTSNLVEATNADGDKSKGVVFAIIALIFSHIFASAYVFRDGEPVPAGKEGLQTWEFIMWILLTVHVLLTVLNLLFSGCMCRVGDKIKPYYFHAGTIPPLRFLVSSFVIVVFSASVGTHPFKDGLYPYTVPLVLSLVAYDSLSGGMF